MKAMVMAAGEGTRLRPLTLHTPKAMIPVANRPVMEYTFDNLKKHGFKEVMVNIHSHAEQIQDHFKDGAQWGIKIHYSYEKKLLGTAGGVKRVEDFFENKTFVILSGDGLTDIHLTKLLQFHRTKKAMATMALKAVDMRFEYGITLSDESQRIKRFLEKPQWSDIYSNMANTGIYVFEPSVLRLIPANKEYDFGHQLWPKLLKHKAFIYSYVMSEYWCDIGNLKEYRRAQQDALTQNKRFLLPGKKLRSTIRVGRNVTIDPSARLEGPCLIGDNCLIGRGVEIGPGTIIGDNVTIASRSTIRSSVIWNRARIEKQSALVDCIVGSNTLIPANTRLWKGVSGF